MFDPVAFIRVIAFGIVYAGIEYKYINRHERDWTKTAEGFVEKPVFWQISPYHFYLLLPLFVIASFSSSVTAWAGNTFFLAALEDMVYFVWRGSVVSKNDWTTTLMGSFRVGKMEVPVWWPIDIAAAVALFVLPL
ncbi:MAG: hypothetical protein JRN56_04830 [Nitrososphaerota archaeon]|nr:hypothetical protein [Nitrososphaerota archaeon]MDG6903372.1 hypothetical protein [Nitrososphaerota archaeon]MDG6911766.1 hypothetical protein [Nitrososphaerota archaeon]MDG6940752.1 hypothetical protein [Nitrososphaerota archaeon]MDG6945643.1 hypothetical protein [Nitrososphaerota archaeon]